MSDNWNTYFSHIDNKPASYLLDMDPWSDGEHEEFVHLYRLSVILNEPNEDGLTTQEEAAVLNRMEDVLNDSLSRRYLFVGRITTNGRRDFYYYTDSADGEELQSRADKAVRHYQYHINRVEEEKPRDFYYESLFPSKSERQRIANRQLIEQLRALGDQLEKPRTVNHWIYFDSATSCNQFKDNVQQAGFRIENQDSEDNKHSLRISRDDVVQFHAISEVTDYLVAVSEEYEGDYDGWETKVIKGSILSRLFKAKK